MEKIVIISEEIINEIRANQRLILQKMEKTKEFAEEKYIGKPKAAELFDCDKQTIANLEKEGLIQRYGRGRFIRYSIIELKKALGISA